MHLEVLVEDQSGKVALDILIPKIIGDNHTFKVHSYKGVGHIPKNMRNAVEPSKRLLLENLPKLLKGYGRTHSQYPSAYQAAVVVVCDLDDKCLKNFKKELLGVLDSCNPKPNTQFCFAIEEIEAWFLGDLNAIKKAYPKAKDAILNSYVNDSICDTWEKLSDAIYPGGSQKLSKQGYQAVGAVKSKWAGKISSLMEIKGNKSPSFCYFRDKILLLTGKVNE